MALIKPMCSFKIFKFIPPKMWLTHRFKDVLTHPHIGSLFSGYRELPPVTGRLVLGSKPADPAVRHRRFAKPWSLIISDIYIYNHRYIYIYYICVYDCLCICRLYRLYIWYYIDLLMLVFGSFLVLLPLDAMFMCVCRECSVLEDVCVQCQPWINAPGRINWSGATRMVPPSQLGSPEGDITTDASICMPHWCINIQTSRDHVP